MPRSRTHRCDSAWGQRRGDGPIVATILAPRYGMKGMYYVLGPGKMPTAHARGPTMDVDPDRATEPVEVVFRGRESPTGSPMALEDALDVHAHLVPLVVASRKAP